MLIPALLTAVVSARNLEAVDDYLYLHRKADAALVAGRLAEARECFRRCLELDPENPTVAYALACVESREGETDRALNWLETAASWGYSDADVALWDNDLAGVREMSGFASVVKRMRESAHKDVKRTIRIDSWPGHYPMSGDVDDRCHVVAIGRSDGVLQLLDGESGRQVGLLDFTSPVWEVRFHADGDRLLVLTEDGRVHDVSIDARETSWSRVVLSERTPKEHVYPFGALLEFDPTGERVLVAGRDRGAALLSAGGDEIHLWREALGDYFSVRLAWSSDGKWIAAARGNDVRFFDGVTGEDAREPIRSSSEVLAVAFSPIGGTMTTGHRDGTMRIWDVQTQSLVSEHLVRSPYNVNAVNALRYSDDGRYIAGSTGEAVRVGVVEVGTSKYVGTTGFLGARMGEVADLSWSPDGNRLWCALSSGATVLHTFDPSTGVESKFFRGRTPRFGASGLGVSVVRGITLLDGATGETLWFRPNLFPREVIQCSSGYFEGDPGNMEGVSVISGAEDLEGVPLKDLACRLFDPKRVRAARAGISLCPALVER